MTERHESAASNDAAIRSVTTEIAGRLSALGIALDGSEAPEQIVGIQEAVERFEQAVQARGGDLMMDEPPRGSAGRPDDKHFALPTRSVDESVDDYLARLERATDEARLHGRGPRAD